MKTFENILIFIMFGIPALLLLKSYIKKKFKLLKFSKLYGKRSNGISPKQFLKYRNGQLKTRTDKYFNTPGIYVIQNKSLNMYYVGQGKRVHERVNDHINGRGNGDIYADMKYGSRLSISIYPKKKGVTLNTMERDYITAYGSKYKLYNKTRGNRG